MYQERPRLSGNKLKAYQNLTKDESRILVIGDLHCPFDLEEYFDFCKETYARFNCNQVIFIGDVIDNHYSSYHETDADGLGGADELELAIQRLQRYYKEFPKADVIIGNHDRLIMRKAQTSAIPTKWIKSYKEVLEVPTWNFTERVVYNDVQYIHGEAGTARIKSRADMLSTVQGHLHTQAYTEYTVGRRFKIFGMQIGSGVDFDSYAMAYAKAGKKPAVGVGVILGGHTPINCMMDL
tara:strand:- start:15 stop:728 length:714 start_codon:yes stop_codon:yes gene_type:complete